jgi:hypothetical protein
VCVHAHVHTCVRVHVCVWTGFIRLRTGTHSGLAQQFLVSQGLCSMELFSYLSYLNILRFTELKGNFPFTSELTGRCQFEL